MANKIRFKLLFPLLLLFFSFASLPPGRDQDFYPLSKEELLQFQLKEPLSHYQYENGAFNFSLNKISNGPGYAIFNLSYPSPMSSGHAVNDSVKAIYYEPIAGGKMPAIVVVHALGSGDATQERWLAGELARRGFAVLFITLPYHMGRRPAGFAFKGVKMIYEADLISRAGRQAVLDVRRGVDWLQGRENVEGGRVGIVGLSMGAVIANLAMGVEPRLKAGVSILGGGDISGIIWHGLVTIMAKFELKRSGYTERSLREKLAPIDPMSFARYNRPRKVYMINGAFDFIIPRKNVKALWLALGKPKITWLPAGHYTALLYKKRIAALTADYLKKELSFTACPRCAM